MQEHKIELSDVRQHLRDAAIKAATNPGLYVAAGTYLYKKFTGPTPFKGRDLTSYKDMCSLYEECTGTEIPEEWKLDKDNCPTYITNYERTKIQLKAALQAVERCNINMGTQVSGMVHKITRSFESLSKRSWLLNGYSPSGFESMFYNELARWFMTELPLCNMTDENTNKMVKRRLNFCQQMYDDVFLYRGDEEKPNPRNTMPDIIEELDSIHQHLCHAYEGANFGNKAGSIDKHLVNTIKHTFDILHLMLNGVDQDVFQVREFVGIPQHGSAPVGRALKNKELKSCLMGQWLIKTCQVAGIKSADYLARNEIQYKEIDTHLPIDIIDLEIEALGFHDFVWRKGRFDITGTDAANFLKNKAPSFLEQIRNLHHSILRLSHIKNALATGSLLTVQYGEAWLFGTEGGEPLLDGLLATLTDACKRHCAVLNEFWGEMYTKTFLPYSMDHHRDPSDETYRHMHTAKVFVKRSNEAITSITTVIGEIKNYGKLAQKRSDSCDEKKYRLVRQLDDALVAIGYDKEKLKKLRELIPTTPPSHSVPSDATLPLSSPQIRPDEELSSHTESKQVNETQIRNACADAITELCDEGGYSPEKIPKKHLDVVYEHYKTQSNTIEAKQKYQSVLAEAARDKQLKIAKKEAKGLLTEESMKIALDVDRLFKKPMKSVFVPLHSVQKLKDEHLALYRGALQPYNDIAKYSLLSGLFGYGFGSNSEQERLRKHHSRLIRILNLITESEPDFYGDCNKVQRDVVNIYLAKGLWDMWKDINSIIIPISLLEFFTHKGGEVNILERRPNNCVRILSPEIMAKKAKTEIADAKAETVTANKRFEEVTKLNATLLEKIEEDALNSQREKLELNAKSEKREKEFESKSEQREAVLKTQLEVDFNKREAVLKTQLEADFNKKRAEDRAEHKKDMKELMELFEARYNGKKENESNGPKS